MRKKNLLVICSMAFLMLYSEIVRGQQGVLLMENQKSGASLSAQAVSEKWPHYPSKHSTLINQVTPRRGQVSNPSADPHKRDTIHGKDDVNLVFGAGESSVVTSSHVAWPGSDGGLHSNSILVGSDYSKNAVVAIADFDGLATGALRDVRFYQKGVGRQNGSVQPDTVNKHLFGINPSYCGSDGTLPTMANRITQYRATLSYDPNKDPLIENFSGIALGTVPTTTASGARISELGTIDPWGGMYEVLNRNGQSTWNNTTNPYVIEVAGTAGAYYWPFKNPNAQEYHVPIFIQHKPGWANYDAFTFYGATADTLYTSTKDATSYDDGQSLLRPLNGEYGVSLTDGDYDTEMGFARYYRPTTVLLSGENRLNAVAVGDVEWYAAYMQGVIWNTVDTLFHTMDPGGCCHYSGWVSYYRDDVRFDTIRTAPSAQLVDAAVRLLDGSDVCVEGDVKDDTDRPYELTATGTETTAAMLVLPGLADPNGDRSNFRLKIGGNALMLHTQDSGSYVGSNPLEDGYLYSDAEGTGPGAKFPASQMEIYLSGGTNTYTEVAGLNWNYAHPRATGTLTVAGTMPYAATMGSVYGVKGEYEGGTNIHTQAVAGNDTTSIIEIGSGTTNQDKFQIYSSGMLKNFRSSCTLVCDSLVIGVDGLAPVFTLSNDLMPLYIINDGDGSGTYCYNGGIYFSGAGVTSLNTAITGATGAGDLHIQSQGFVKFYDESPAFALAKDNEVKILSDNSLIYVQNDLSFTNADTAHLTVWAKGLADAARGYSDLSFTTGAVQVDGSVNAAYAGSNGTGLILFRSDNDDVLVGTDFTFTNEAKTVGSGELMVQAGQDIRIDGNTTLTHDGQRSMLFEAQKTAAFGGDFTATLTGTTSNGDLTIKAGYPNFLPTADVNAPLNWAIPSVCVEGGYANREANQPAATGGDIWFGGNAAITLTPAKPDSVDTYIRAYNSIYMDGDFKHSLASGGYTTGDLVDTTLLFAETGNVEAINQVGTDVVFDISDVDSMYLLVQAGNSLGNPCGFTNCYINDEWHGNILFGNNKTFSVNHLGVGPTLLSASRDIENQVGANFNFVYENQALGDQDNLLITAGRHIETHAAYNFDYTRALKEITSSITMQAGHQAEGCNFTLCKDVETASNLGYNVTGTDTKDNTFAEGGAGQGSILLFDSATFNYDGKGEILMTALNGNIESDPYLHKGSGAGYDGAGNIHESQLTFNHGGTGITRLEAIDIKLHDKIEYNGSTADQLQNGQFYMAAFDSVLTRNLAYHNLTDTGSVFITTDKLKRNPETNAVLACDENMAGIGGINQGHIVLGYGADCSNTNVNDSIVFDFAGNPALTGANVYIRAGYDGFENNPVTGKVNTGELFKNNPKDMGKGYGGNITFDYIKADMATGDHTAGGYMEISTPNGNIWGKDSITYNAWEGDFLIDAGLGSLEDTLRATRWSDFSGPLFNKGNGQEDILNTSVPFACGPNGEWRTGNIMLKGAGVTFNNGNGNMTFRTREGFIDTYDAFTVSDMQGHLLKYAGMDNLTKGRENNWGDVSERDFRYVPTTNSGSVFFGADDNIMLNYGNSNFMYPNYGDEGMGYPGNYDVSGTYSSRMLNGLSGANPYYHTFYEEYIDGLCTATFNVNEDGYLFYRNPSYSPNRKLHLLYRGCVGDDCSGITGDCETTSNGARDLALDYRNSVSGGFASVASNYIDLFTKFEYQGGTGTGLHSVPGMGTLHGETVAGYGLYMKSQFNGVGSNYPEKRRATCEGCGELSSFPIDGRSSRAIPEMTYIGFHDDARIHTHNQKSLLEAPVVEFFGHAELDTKTDRGVKTNITLKADSLIFHDSVIFAGTAINLKPFTTDATQRGSDMRYGVINDGGSSRANYNFYGPAIEMADRGLPVPELGYQRCNEPNSAPNASPNVRSLAGKEKTPTVGGDVIVAFKYGYAMPMFNTVVANHARISFISDSLDNMQGGEYVDAFIRTDLLRVRNNVEFYTDPAAPKDRKGKFVMATPAQMDDQMVDPGMYMRHLHMEPGSELSIPGEDSLTVIPTTVVGGYGNIHENVMVKANGILAPGFASLMEGDCQTPYTQGKLTVHNLQMEKDAVLRISISNRNCVATPDGPVNCTQTDTVVVQDTVYFTDGRVPVIVLPETETIDPGCYLFMVYGDSTGISQEYVKNFVLEETRYGDYYFGLNFSEPGKVYLCVSTYPLPDIQRWIDMPEIAGVTTNPGVGRSHVVSNQHFTFTAKFSGAPLKVRALGFYSGENRDLDYTGILMEDGSYQYTIYQVVQPWTIQIGPDLSTSPGVSNEGISGQRVWTYKNTLYINAEMDDIVSIYNMTGVLYRKVDISAGTNKFTLERGMYVVTLKDGTVHKIVIK